MILVQIDSGGATLVWIEVEKCDWWREIVSRLSDGLFDFNFLVLNILKEADINFVFKVLAKFGDYKDNKEI